MKFLLFLLLPISLFSQVQRGSGFVTLDARGKPFYVDTAQTVVAVTSEELRVRLIEAEKLSTIIDNLIWNRDHQKDSAKWFYFENQVKQAVVVAEKLKGKTREERMEFMAAWNEKHYRASTGSSVNEADVKNVRLYSPQFK